MSELVPPTITRANSRETPSARTVPYLFVVLDCEHPYAAPSRHSLAGLDDVVIGRGTVRSVEREGGNAAGHLDVRLPDHWVSGTHARIVHVFGQWVLEDLQSKNGTSVGGRPIAKQALVDGDVIEIGHTLLLFKLGATLDAFGPPDVAADALEAVATPRLSTLSPGLSLVFATIPRIAASPVSVVVGGETGTGKEVVARAVHELSRRTGAFVAVNCGAIPENLIASELFGHRRGSFSGAVDDSLGLVRAADGGTLFLDEIGDLSTTSQAAFLRVLQEREVMPVGGLRAVPVDLRLIAATHRDLGDLIDSEKFRPDLLARISGFTLTMPPLRTRREDIGLLIATILSRLDAARFAGVTFETDAARALLQYDWPLNIRELEKCVGAAAVLAGGRSVLRTHLPEAVQAAAVQPIVAKDRQADEDVEPDDARLSDADRRLRAELVRLLAEHSGNVSAVAREMGKARMQIQRWMKRFRLGRDETLG
ncbi:MAG: sigma 54-interacting transcriptional regulator [Deltaproteobacteria bacterium]|nr:sigma 54-interacting transcriptional regulator [Deltaproteobacteria bacterium]